MTTEKTELINSMKGDLERWRRSPKPITTVEEAKQCVKEPTTYLLRMIWLGRYDKMSTEQRKVLDAVSKLYLPAEYGYQGCVNGEVVLQDQDHYALASLVFDGLWADYVALNTETEPLFQVKPKTGLLGKIGSLFKGK